LDDKSRTYNEIIVQARNENLADNIDNLTSRLGKEYVESISENIDLRRIDEPEKLVGAFRVAMRQYAREGERAVREATLLSLKQSLQSHRKAIRQLELIPLNELEEAFREIPVRAFENMYERRGLDVAKSFKSVRRWRGSYRIVEEELQRMIRNGKSYNKAARSIMTGLAQGDPELRKAASQYGPRGGLKRWARRSGIEPNQRLSQLARRLGSDARQIARTEIAQSFHEADRMAAMESGITKGLKWTLSKNHPGEDICDKLAQQDKYDLGSGVYPADELPVLPHPHCMCSTRFILD
jgi:hypothetical protein